MASLPPLDLAIEVTGADGAQTRWDSATAATTPQGLGFRTKQGDGFADANMTLARRIDRDYIDLSLLDSVVISGADGNIAYEGRVAGVPRSMSQTHSVTVQCAGGMAHARDRKMSEIYVDRDLGRWGPPSAQRMVDLLPTRNLQDGRGAISDPTAGNGIYDLYLTGTWTAVPRVEALYDAGANNKIGSIYYSNAIGNGVSGTDANWTWQIWVSDDDRATNAAAVTGNPPGATNTGTLTVPSTTPTARFATIMWQHGGSGGAEGVPYHLYWKQLAVFGNHGLPRRGADPGGIYASDAIRHLIGKYCPQINTNGVTNTTYPIPHLVFRDRVDPYDALLEINKYHLWQLGVYDNKTLQYEPVDMSDYDWEVRLSDPGVTVDLQGDSSDNLANGIVVTYTDVAKSTINVLTPTDYPDLADISPDNPVNAHGLTKWTELTLSTPTTQDGALQIGRAALAEYNQAKSPGTISVQGHIRDRQGHYHPCWRVRAGDRIAITDHPNDRPRLVAETDYQHDSRTISIAVDSSFKRLDAVLDRLSTALSAANLA
jgi:hypothetical protein